LPRDPQPLIRHTPVRLSMKKAAVKKTAAPFVGSSGSRAIRISQIAEWLYLIVSAHCPTQNRFALLLEMLCFTHCPTQNRFALLLEMLCFTHCPTQNRFALLLEMLCFTHCPTQNRFALLLELLCFTHCPTRNRFALLLEMLQELFLHEFESDVDLDSIGVLASFDRHCRLSHHALGPHGLHHRHRRRHHAPAFADG